MIQFGDIEDEILQIKIKKVCIVQIGMIPDAASYFTINDDCVIDGDAIVNGVEYTFIKNTVVAKCQYCGNTKNNIFGICEKCHRFPVNKVNNVIQ